MTVSILAKEFFRNYEVEKLHVNNPLFLNASIYFILLLIALTTLRKKPSNFLDFSQTEQLKGLAMLFVVIGHFWYHVCNEHRIFLYMGDYAVTLFLLLSGYGLMSSNMLHKVNLREFVRKRLIKIFIPYWLVTIGIILADYILLQRQSPPRELILTFSGINMPETLQHFEYARWFITLLLLYYLAFFFCAKLLPPTYATLSLLLLSLALILLRRSEIFPLGAGHQILAFPMGCLLSVIRPIKYWRKASIRYQTAIIILATLSMLSIYQIMGRHSDSYCIDKAFIYLESYAQPYLFCLICVSSISLLASTGYTSKFLNLFGYLSYEIYLIHGPLLIKYNPVLGRFEKGGVLIGILLWFGVTLGLAHTLKSTHQWLTINLLSQKATTRTCF